MQSFVYPQMNEASRKKDFSKIQFYGPLASAMGYTIQVGNHKDTDLSDQFVLYRGLKVNSKKVAIAYKPGQLFQFSGFTNSTLSRETAVSFAKFTSEK